MTEQNPVLKIPESKGRDLKPVEVELLFDDPHSQEKPSKYGGTYNLHMYTVSVGGVEHTLFAYDKQKAAIDAAGGRAGDRLEIINVGEGEWQVGNLSRPDAQPNAQPPGQATEPVTQATGAKSTEPVRAKPAPAKAAQTWRRLSDDEMDGLLSAADEQLDIISQITVLIQGYPQFEGLSPEEMIDLATTALIGARKSPRYREGMVTQDRAKESEMSEFVSQVNKLVDAGRELPGAILGTVGARLGIGQDRAKAILAGVYGLSSDDINPEDPESWYRLHKVASRHTYLLSIDIPEEKAREDVARTFDLDLPQSPEF